MIGLIPDLKTGKIYLVRVFQRGDGALTYEAVEVDSDEAIRSAKLAWGAESA